MIQVEPFSDQESKAYDRTDNNEVNHDAGGADCNNILYGEPEAVEADSDTQKRFAAKDDAGRPGGWQSVAQRVSVEHAE